MNSYPKTELQVAWYFLKIWTGIFKGDNVVFPQTGNKILQQGGQQDILHSMAKFILACISSHSIALLVHLHICQSCALITKNQNTWKRLSAVKSQKWQGAPDQIWRWCESHSCCNYMEIGRKKSGARFNINSWVQPPILTISSNLAIVAKLGDPKCL